MKEKKKKTTTSTLGDGGDVVVFGNLAATQMMEWQDALDSGVWWWWRWWHWWWELWDTTTHHREHPNLRAFCMPFGKGNEPSPESDDERMCFSWNVVYVLNDCSPSWQTATARKMNESLSISSWFGGLARHAWLQKLITHVKIAVSNTCKFDHTQHIPHPRTQFTRDEQHDDRLSKSFIMQGSRKSVKFTS